MSLKAPVGGNKNFVAQANLEPDVYPARLVQVIDFGLQPQKPYQGQSKPPANEIGFTYELVTEFMKDEDGEDIEDKPRWVSESMALRSLKAENAKSTDRAKAFDPENVHEGDFAMFINTPVNVTIVNNKVGEKVYDNIATVAAMSAKKAATLPELKNPAKVFTLDDPDMETFNKFPKWIQDKIKSNLNFKGSKLEKLVAAQPQKEESKKEEQSSDNPW